MTVRSDEINEFMLSEMKKHGIEPTPELRLAFLEGLRDAWNEDEETNTEKVFYQLALNAMIFGEKMLLMFPPIKV